MRHHRGNVVVICKACARCGRRFLWSREQRLRWHSEHFCSAFCRERPLTAVDRGLEIAIMIVVSQRGPDGTLCPTEAAKLAGGPRWPELMGPTLEAARRLALAGRVELLQGGRAVEPSLARGPIELRLPACRRRRAEPLP